MLIWRKSYYGFDDFADYFKDIAEAVDPLYNPAMKDIPGEFLGTMRITIEYIEEGEE